MSKPNNMFRAELKIQDIGRNVQQFETTVGRQLFHCTEASHSCRLRRRYVPIPLCGFNRIQGIVCNVYNVFIIIIIALAVSPWAHI